MKDERVVKPSPLAGLLAGLAAAVAALSLFLSEPFHSRSYEASQAKAAPSAGERKVATAHPPSPAGLSIREAGHGGR